MLMSSHNLHQYWVLAYYKEKDGNASRGKMLVHAESEFSAAGVFQACFRAQGFSSFYYESLIAATVYLEQSREAEWLCIRALHSMAGRTALIFEERKITCPPAIEQDWFTLNADSSPECIPVEGRVYLLIDGALYHTCSGKFILPVLYSLNCRWGCLLQGDAQAASEDYAPYLIEIPSVPERTLTQQQFLTWCCENPAGILLHSSRDFAALSQHFRKFTYLPVADNTTWCFFRFYDPGIFYLLVSHLNTAEVRHFFQGITGCRFLHEGNACVLSYDPEQNNKVTPERVTITPYLQQVFQQARQAALITKIEESLPAPADSSGTGLPADERKNLIIRTLNQAYLLGLTHPKALYYFLTAEICFPDENRASRWEAAEAYSSSQIVRALHYLELTLKCRIPGDSECLHAV